MPLLEDSLVSAVHPLSTHSHSREAQSDNRETAEEHRKRWFSLKVAYVIALLLGLQESIYLSSLWPFLSQVDQSVTEDFFGYIIMAFNLGSVISSPIYGVIVNRLHQTRLPIAFGLLLTVVGNLLVAFTEAFPIHRRYVLLTGRFVTGTGMGTEGAIFAYIAMSSTPSERGKAVAIRAAILATAISTGPLLQVILVPIGYPGISIGPFHLNMYTAPAFGSALFGVVQIAIVLTIFREFWISVAKSENEGSNDDYTVGSVVL